MTEKNYFGYNQGTDITKGAFRISASQVNKFFDTTSQWYHEHLMGEKGFTGSTATHLGTVVHAAIEMRVIEGTVNYQDIEQYIYSITDPEVDKNTILQQYMPMIETVLPYVEANMPTEVERFVFEEILPGIGAGGSIDSLKAIGKPVKNTDGSYSYPNGVDMTDWKTTSSKTQVTRFTRAY